MTSARAAMVCGAAFFRLSALSCRSAAAERLGSAGSWAPAVAFRPWGPGSAGRGGGGGGCGGGGKGGGGGGGAGEGGGGAGRWLRRGASHFIAARLCHGPVEIERFP